MDVSGLEGLELAGLQVLQDKQLLRGVVEGGRNNEQPQRQQQQQELPTHGAPPGAAEPGLELQQSDVVTGFAGFRLPKAPPIKAQPPQNEVEIKGPPASARWPRTPTG